MSKRVNVMVFKHGGNSEETIKIFKAIVKARYKTEVDFTTKRGDFIVKTELSESTIQKLNPDWVITHQTERRVVFEKR